MSKKQIREREQRNRELGQLDRANRCSVCQVELLTRPAIQRVGDSNRYCSACYAGLYTPEEIEQFKAEDR